MHRRSSGRSSGRSSFVASWYGSWPREFSSDRAWPDRKTELAIALASPFCKEGSWNVLALEAAEVTGRPIAQGERSKPREITVNFPEACAFVAGVRPGPRRLAVLGIPALVSLVLLLGSLLSLCVALIKLRVTRVTAAPVSQPS
jgi:hypothetical protein